MSFSLSLWPVPFPWAACWSQMEMIARQSVAQEREAFHAQLLQERDDRKQEEV